MLYYQIREFLGIQQQADGALLPIGSASDARNVDTFDGNLCVAKGFEKHINTIVPGTDRILKLLIARGDTARFFVVTANNIYAYINSAWSSIYTFSTPIPGEQVDYLQTQIGSDDYIIVATGHQQMVKIKLSDNTASLLGTGLYSFEGTVLSYDSATLTITLSASLSADAIRHAPLDGISIDGTLLEVASASGSSVTLKEAPSTAPAAENAATIRGGGSNASCNFVDLYYGRLFSSGDPNAPCRLYWSAAPGDGRTVEDWLSVTGSEEASGGYVEIGDASGDAIIGMCVLSTQILIFKKYSVYRLHGDRPSTYAVERVENYAQTMSNASVVVKYDTPHYFTKDGMYYYDGTGILPLNTGYRVLRRFMDTITSVSASKGLHCNNALYFSCRVSSDDVYDDSIVVYDVARESFMIRDGFKLADMAVHDGCIYIITDGRYVCEFNKGTSYDGENITAYWCTQPTDLNAKYAKKQIKEIMFRGKSGRAMFLVRSGASKAWIPKNLINENDGYVSVAVSVDNARVFELRIENEAGSYFEICGGMDIAFIKEVAARS